MECTNASVFSPLGTSFIASTSKESPLRKDHMVLQYDCHSMTRLGQLVNIPIIDLADDRTCLYHALREEMTLTHAGTDGLITDPLLRLGLIPKMSIFHLICREIRPRLFLRSHVFHQLLPQRLVMKTIRSFAELYQRCIMGTRIANFRSRPRPT